MIFKKVENPAKRSSPPKKEVKGHRSIKHAKGTTRIPGQTIYAILKAHYYDYNSLGDLFRKRKTAIEVTAERSKVTKKVIGLEPSLRP